MPSGQELILSALRGLLEKSSVRVAYIVVVDDSGAVGGSKYEKAGPRDANLALAAHAGCIGMLRLIAIEHEAGIGAIQRTAAAQMPIPPLKS